MKKTTTPVRSAIFTTVLLISMSLGGFLPSYGQDLVTVADVTGGSSAFVFRRSSAQTHKFTTTANSTRTQAQRLATAQKIQKQYQTQAKTAPQRVRSKVVSPDDVPLNIKTVTPQEASTLFAGVGEYYIDHDDLENSIDFFRQSVSLDGTNRKAKEGLSDALAIKGSKLLVDGQTDAAKANFLEALQDNPKNAQAYFGLGSVYDQTDQSADAIASYEKALASDPGLTSIFVPLGILYFQNGDIAKADDLLTKALANNSATAETQTLLGMIRFSQNRNDDALKAYAAAKKLDPNYPEAYLHSGDALVRLGKLNDALVDYQKAVSLRNNYVEAWRGVGSVQATLKDYNDAISAYQQAVKLKNNSSDTFLELGDVYRLAGRYNDAESSYATARDLMAQNSQYTKDDIADVNSKIGFVIGQECEENQKNNLPCKWSGSITALQKALSLGSGNAADYANLGWAYYKAAEYDMAVGQTADGQTNLALAKTNLEKAIAGHPQYIDGPLLNLGMTLSDMGDYSGAVDKLTQVVNDQPTWTFAMNELGIAYRKQNDYKNAIIQFKRATDGDNTFAAAYYNLAESSYHDGKMSDARKAYARLKELGRTDLANQLMSVTNGAVDK